MPEGLLIENEGNKVQIDSKYRNLHYFKKISGTLFLHSTEHVHAFKSNDSNPFSIRCYCMDNVNCYYELSKNVDSYQFGWNVPAAAESFGLEVYDAGGKVVFSSSTKPLRVLDFVTLNVARVSDVVVFNKRYSGKSIAIIPSQIPYNFERNNQNIRGYSFIFTVTGDSLSVKYGIAKEWRADRGSITGSAARNDVFQPYANFLVVDITGY